MYELTSDHPKAVAEANRVFATMLEDVDIVSVCDVHFASVKSLEVMDTTEEKEAHTLFIHLSSGERAGVEIGLPHQILKVNVAYRKDGSNVLEMMVWES